MNRNARRRSVKRWGAFDDEWNLIVYGDTERECRKALTEYRNHVINLVEPTKLHCEAVGHRRCLPSRRLEPTYRIMEYYDES